MRFLFIWVIITLLILTYVIINLFNNYYKNEFSYDSNIYQKEDVYIRFEGLKTLGVGFFKNYWYFVLLFLGIFGFGGFFSFKQFKTKKLKKRIMKLRMEKSSLNDLIKLAQEERFRQNTISGLVYNIRMQKYMGRINKINQELPVLESNLGKQETEKPIK